MATTFVSRERSPNSVLRMIGERATANILLSNVRGIMAKGDELEAPAALTMPITLASTGTWPSREVRDSELHLTGYALFHTASSRGMEEG